MGLVKQLRAALAPVSLLAPVLGCTEPTRSAVLSDGTTVAVITIGHHEGPLPGTQLTDSDLIPFINYYAPSSADADRDAEVERVAALLVPAAEASGDTLILVQRTTPLLSRSLPVVRGQVYLVRRGCGGLWSHQASGRVTCR